VIRYFCDLCETEITNRRVYLLEVDTDDTQGNRHDPVPSFLGGRLFKRRVCAGCAARAIEPVPQAADEVSR
jgi:hypothetical protein